MFDTLIQGFRGVRSRLQGFRKLDEATVDEVLAEIKPSLLEADVELKVARAFLARVKEKALGQMVRTQVKHKGKRHEVSAADQFIRICHEELVSLMGEGEEELKVGQDGISRMMVVGLQGSGKTTTAAKLANLLKSEGKRPMLVAADIYRPAAVDQLKVLGDRVGVPVFFEDGMSPPELCERGVAAARADKRDVIIFDTAGRLTIDEQLMGELSEIRRRTSPEGTFLVVDAMIGQDAVRTARSFHERVPLDGVVLTKLDGDARGGAALSVKEVTGRPILFVGMGEALDRLERFRPEGMADRILGMGDIVGLVQDFERVVDAEKAEEDAMRMLKGKFTFMDFLEQIRAIKQMGSLRDTLEKMPFFHEIVPEGADFDENAIHRFEAMIQSMTPQERNQPDVLEQPGRIERIAKGCGSTTSAVSDLVGRFKAMREVLGALGSSPGLLGRIPGFKQMAQLAKIKNMDMSEFFGMPMGMGRAPKPRRPPVTLQRVDARSARRARKAAKARKKKKRR